MAELQNLEENQQSLIAKRTGKTISEINDQLEILNNLKKQLKRKELVNLRKTWPCLCLILEGELEVTSLLVLRILNLLSQ